MHKHQNTVATQDSVHSCGHSVNDEKNCASVKNQVKATEQKYRTSPDILLMVN